MLFHTKDYDIKNRPSDESTDNHLKSPEICLTTCAAI